MCESTSRPAARHQSSRSCQATKFSTPWNGRSPSALGLRPFHGVENFVAWQDLEDWCRAAGLEVLSHIGFHPWPFQLGLDAAAARVESYFGRGRAARFMVNQALLAKKPA